MVSTSPQPSGHCITRRRGLARSTITASPGCLSRESASWRLATLPLRSSARTRTLGPHAEQLFGDYERHSPTEFLVIGTGGVIFGGEIQESVSQNGRILTGSPFARERTLSNLTNAGTDPAVMVSGVAERGSVR